MEWNKRIKGGKHLKDESKRCNGITAQGTRCKNAINVNGGDYRYIGCTNGDFCFHHCDCVSCDSVQTTKTQGKRFVEPVGFSFNAPINATTMIDFINKSDIKQLRSLCLVVVGHRVGVQVMLNGWKEIEEKASIIKEINIKEEELYALRKKLDGICQEEGNI
jgi:hypothetical protein